MYPILCMIRLRYESHQHHLNAMHAHTKGIRSDEIGLLGSVRVFILSRSPLFFCDVFGLSPGVRNLFLLQLHLSYLYPYALLYAILALSMFLHICLPHMS